MERMDSLLFLGVNPLPRLKHEHNYKTLEAVHYGP